MVDGGEVDARVCWRDVQVGNSGAGIFSDFILHFWVQRFQKEAAHGDGDADYDAVFHPEKERGDEGDDAGNGVHFCKIVKALLD